MNVVAVGIAGIAGLASSALAQFQTQGTITYTLSSEIFGEGLGTPWTNPIPGGNGDDRVELGEGVLFKIEVGMSIAPGHASTQYGPRGGPLTWPPSVSQASSGSGTNAGFWNGDLSLVGEGGSAAAAGVWSDGSAASAALVRRSLIVATAGNGIGSPNGNGSGLTDIQPQQFAGDVESISHSNNFITFQALWIPSDSVTVRIVTFALSVGPMGHPSEVAASDADYDLGFVLPVDLTCASSYTGAQTLIVGDIPEPAGVGLLALMGLGAARRRRPVDLYDWRWPI